MSAHYDAKGLDMGVGDYSFSPDVRQREIMRELGYLSGRQEQAEEDRIAAFGAIRRAAEVARRYDDSDTHKFDQSNSYENTGDVMRRAIRSAIGSPKA